MSSRGFWQRIALRLTLLAGLVGVARAQDRAALEAGVGRFEAELKARLGAEVRVQRSESGHLTFLTLPKGAGVALKARPADGKPESIARAFLSEHRPLLHDGGAVVDYATRKINTAGARANVKLDQTYAGLPVFGAQAIVQVEAGQVTALHARLMTRSPILNPKFSLKAVIGPVEAQAKALAGVEKKPADARATTAALEIYDPTLIGNAGAPALVWHFFLESPGGAPFRQELLVSARDGRVLLRMNRIHTARNRQIYDSNNTAADPGTLRRAEGGAVSGISDVDLAYDYFGDTYDFYFSNHGRDSINGAGSALSATVRFCTGVAGDACPYDNAYWDGTRMYFGQGFAAADDVVAHELTHGVTENESNLVYANQSGAINESFSDMWGEWIDLSNTGGTDTPAVRWLMGEDIPGIGAIRNMANPPQFNDPDRMGSPNWYNGPLDDGGVHWNSGVGNKLCYLLTDGGSFNGRTVTALGIAKTADLFYEAQVNLLTPSSNYLALYNAITQAAITLGFTPAERDAVEQASIAVEINVPLVIPTPGNDECANARTLADGITFTSTTTGATGTLASSCGGGGDVNDVWFKFTATATGTGTVDTIGSVIDTVLVAYTACGGTALGCNDDIVTGSNTDSLLSLSMTSGTTYYLRVSGFGGETGAYSIKVTGPSTGGGGVNLLAGGICLNELLVDPNSGTWNYDTDANGTADTADDFIELHNAGTAPVNIGGWKLWTTGVSRYTFPANTIIPVGGFAVVVAGLQAGGTLPTPQAGSFAASASLAGVGLLINGGDNVVVLDTTNNKYIHAYYNGDTVDTPSTYSGFPAGATITGAVENWGNDTDGSSIGRFADGTTNLAIYGTASSGSVLATPGRNSSTVPVELSQFAIE